MTAIAGFTDGKTVWIGGDSAGSSDDWIVTRKDSKVFKIKDMIFGFTDSFRMGQIIQFHLNPPKQDIADDFKYMVKKFIPALQKVLSKYGYEQDDGGRKEGGTFLVGYKGVIYDIEEDYQVGILIKNYNACGCGRELCMGAFHALENFDMEPEDRVKAALSAAAKFSSAVQEPFNIINI